MELHHQAKTARNVAVIVRNVLSPEGVRQAVKGMGDQVKNVIQQAADALHEDKSNSPAASVAPSTSGSNNGRSA
jgi:hypothetical protein